MIGIIGGTGPQGKGLAYRLADAGVDVLIGSRSAERGANAASDIAAMTGSGRVEGTVNDELPDRSEMLLVAVPYVGLADTLRPFADRTVGKVVMSAVNNLTFLQGPQALPVEAGSAAEEVAEVLPGALVTTAFNNVSASHLLDTSHHFDEDVLVCGEDEGAITQTLELVNRVPGLRGVACGGLRLASTVEAMTALIISVNKRHQVTAGVRLTGL